MFLFWFSALARNGPLWYQILKYDWMMNDECLSLDLNVLNIFKNRNSRKKKSKEIKNCERGAHFMKSSKDEHKFKLVSTSLSLFNSFKRKLSLLLISSHSYDFVNRKNIRQINVILKNFTLNWCDEKYFICRCQFFHK